MRRVASGEGGRSEAPQTMSEEAAATLEIFSFHLSGEEYAVPVEAVREIIRPQRSTRIPRAPSFLLGVTALRGQILPIFDLRCRLGLSALPPDRSTRILVLTVRGAPAGVWVDRVGGVMRLPVGAVNPPPGILQGVAAEYLLGVAQHEGRLIILLNVERALGGE